MVFHSTPPGGAGNAVFWRPAQSQAGFLSLTLVGLGVLWLLEVCLGKKAPHSLLNLCKSSSGTLISGKGDKTVICPPDERLFLAGAVQRRVMIFWMF